MVAGGRNLGIRQGVFHNMVKSDAPLSNLLLTFRYLLDVPAKRFSDSTGTMKEVLV